MRSFLKTAAVIAIGVALCYHDPAIAAPATSPQHVASEYWADSPCRGVEQVSVRPAMDPMYGRLATIQTLGVAYLDGSCRVVIRPEVAADWFLLCRVLVHEFGHLAGLGHDEHDPIMAPTLNATMAPCQVFAPKPKPATKTRRR